MCKHIAALQQYCIASHQKQDETSVSLTYPHDSEIPPGIDESKK